MPDISLSVRVQPKLKLTLQTRQSLKVLQMPAAELSKYLENQLESNPFLETLGDGFLRKERVPFESENTAAYEGIASPLSLSEYLLRQWRCANYPAMHEDIGERLIESLDENGYLRQEISEISDSFGVSPEEAEHVLSLVQNLDPPGIACRNLRECLLMQADRMIFKEKDAELKRCVIKIVESYLSDLVSADKNDLAQRTGFAANLVERAVQIIKSLDPKPGRGYQSCHPKYIYPDVVFIKKQRGGFEVKCQQPELPELKINSQYLKLLKNPKTPPEAKLFLKQQFESAITLLRSIQQRRSTIERLSKCLAVTQSEFLRKGVLFLKPCRMADLAGQIGVHKSTISRAVSGKYAQTPQGLVSMKNFFSNPAGKGSLVFSQRQVQAQIQALISKTDKLKILTDLEITRKLELQGVVISRRTVAKYRKKIKVPCSYFRK